MPGKPWTEKDDKLLKALYPDTVTADLCKRLGRSDRAVYARANLLGLKKDPEYLDKHVHTINPEAGRAYRMHQGNDPWNKGFKGWQAGGRAKETQFKTGHLNGAAKAKRVEIGFEKRDKDGVLIRKVSDDINRRKRWRPVHVLIYEENFGPVPKGCIVVFKDRNRDNFKPENLEAITRAENMRRNSHYNRYPIEISRLIQLRGALNRQINKRVSHEESN